MAAIPRKTALILGGGITNPNGLVEGPAGSYAAGGEAGVTYSLDPAVIQNVAAGSGSVWLQGFLQMLVQTGGGVNSPPHQTLEAIFLTLSQQIAYVLQHGLPEWDSTGETPYYQWAIATVGGIAYQCIVAGPVVTNPTVDTNSWAAWAPGVKQSPGVPNQGVLQAKVCFDGTGGVGTCPIYGTAVNVSSVQKITVGTYLINFATPLVDANYAWSGSTGEPNGFVGNQGNVICGTVFGTPATKTVSQLSILCVEIQPNQLVDSSAISVLVC